MTPVPPSQWLVQLRFRENMLLLDAKMHRLRAKIMFVQGIGIPIVLLVTAKFDLWAGGVAGVCAALLLSDARAHLRDASVLQEQARLLQQLHTEIRTGFSIGIKP